jgi:murein DD-endopeptidase MepM/ murein hydrolase activator NlpD
MRNSVFQRFNGRQLSHGLLVMFTASLLAGCSNSIERFQASYDNPSDSDPVYTASVPKAEADDVAAAVPARKYKPYVAPKLAAADDVIEETPVTRAPLAVPKPKYDYTDQYAAAPKLYKAKPKFTAPVAEELDAPVEEAPVAEAVVDEVAPVKPSKRLPFATANQGIVEVEQGMTLNSIAKANHVDAMALAQYNKMKPPYHVWAGQKLRIPEGEAATYAQLEKPAKKHVDQAEEQVADVAPAPKAKAGGVHTVSSGDSLYSIGRKFGVSPYVIADANGIDSSSSLKIGQELKIPGPGEKIASAKPSKKPALSLAEEEDQSAPEVVAETKSEPEAVETAEAPKTKPVESAESQTQVASANGLSMRWPVKGKVISDFGPKTNGLKNEGINIAVPEGTSIRAAEGGVVAYAGNELKGYGNLVLLRHAGGYVTAYAHAKELMVKRGDTVKRGDVIAKAGQSGAVSSPQVHFEVRKGATALDPMKHLSSSTAMN